MSKRRKNAGEGYGFMFSGAFAKKSDAVAKEKTRKGSFVKGMPTRHGYRYVVMTPRTNPRRSNPAARAWAAFTAEEKRELKRLGFKKSSFKTEADVQSAKAALARMEATRGNSVAWGKKNPTELLVMGANPQTHEVTANKGDTITIRVNPTALSRSTDDSRFMLAAAAQLYPGKSLAALTGAELSKVAMLAARLKRENPYFGFGPSRPSKKELAASRREFKGNVRRKTEEDRAYIRSLRPKRRARGQAKLDRLFHEVYGQNPATCGAMIGGYPCTRKPGHRGPHLPQGATLRPRSRHNWGPRGNPSAEALRESFTGTEVDRVTVHREGHMPAGDYALLGKLLALYVKPLAGGQVQMIKPSGTTVVSDESARQLYFVGGDQDVTLALGVFGARERSVGLVELGEARRIDYKQRKEHVPDPDVDEWRHEFGEETGERPLVLFDAKHKRLLLEGGAYVVRAEGIVN
jgi:hypothetical protein